MRLLCLSNGHGEDQIALQVLKALRQLPHAPTIEVLPIVGEGHAYAKQGFNIIGTVKAMPSGGFIYMDSKQLAQDIQGGLLKLTLQQLKAIRQWAKAAKAENAIVLAVGDIVPLFFAWQSGLQYAFIGTAKSEYYLRDETQWHPRNSWWDDRLSRITGSVYYPWERWLLGHPNCRASFPRDRITAQQLQKFGLPAYDFGNPMMDFGINTESLQQSDFIEYQIDLKQDQIEENQIKQDAIKSLKILLLPGSRIPEAYHNWDIILSGIENLITQSQAQTIHFLVALSPELDREMLQTALTKFNWTQSNQTLSSKISDNTCAHASTNTLENSSSDTFTHLFAHPNYPHRLTLGFAKFSEYAHRADLAIAMAGTATEQFVGLGKPAITLPGHGPQFTPAFAEAQTRLLGSSIFYLSHPSQIAPTVQNFLHNPNQQESIAINGKKRMGEPGSSVRIAQKLIQLLNSQSNL